MTAIVWSKTNCPYCDQAKNLLKIKGVEYEERLIGAKWTIEDLLKEVPNAKTVPQIFLEGKLVGGFTELKKHFDNV